MVARVTWQQHFECQLNLRLSHRRSVSLSVTYHCVQPRNSQPQRVVSLLMKPLLLLLAATLVSCAATFKDVPYVAGGDPLQCLDLYVPPGKSEEPRPVVIAIHGGGWAYGKKDSRGFVQPKTRWFLQHGFLVASINYRLSPAVTHPAHIGDVCAAIAAVQQRVAQKGGDPGKIYLLGHSAGAHLAALAAVDRERLTQAGADPAGIRGVILLDGAAYDVPRQIAAARSPSMETIYRNAFTDDPATQRDASPTLKVAKYNATPPPFLILHISSRRASTLQAEGLAKALRAAGGEARVVAVPDKTHVTINRDFGRPDDPTTTAAAEFLDLR